MVRMEKRPTTATLIKPAVLDARLLGIFDMTTVSREHLLAIKNLVHSTPRCKCKSTISVMETFAIDCASAKVCADDDMSASIQKALKDLNNKTYRIRRHDGRSKLTDSEEQASSEERKPKVPCIPVPCATCGRPNQPERFHSHPSRHQVKTKELLSTKATDKRKTVQKPVPIKFRSAKNKSNDVKETSKGDGRRDPPPHAKPKPQRSPKRSNITGGRSTPDPADKVNTKIKAYLKEATQRGTQQQPKHDDSSTVDASHSSRTPRYEAYKLDTWIPAPVSGERKRKVVCSLCSQEFGTALLPSHEAQCLRKYLGEIGDSNATQNDEEDDIENQKEIPSSQAKENWKLAWELTQTVLIPCKCCGRKFLPSRVEAHQKICSLKSKNHCRLKINRPSKSDAKWSNGGMNRLPKAESERLKNVRDDHSSPSISPETIPNKNSSGRIVKLEEHNETEIDTVEIFWKAHQSQLVPCSKCGRTFYPHRLEVHVRGCKETSKHKRKPMK